MTERQTQIALVRKLRESAEFHRVAKEIAEALIILGAPATEEEIAEIVNAHASELRSMLSFLVHVKTLECTADAPIKHARIFKYGFARQSGEAHAAHP